LHRWRGDAWRATEQMLIDEILVANVMAKVCPATGISTTDILIEGI
jgi:hypothetical protein